MYMRQKTEFQEACKSEPVYGKRDNQAWKRKRKQKAERKVVLKDVEKQEVIVKP